MDHSVSLDCNRHVVFLPQLISVYITSTATIHLIVSGLDLVVLEFDTRRDASLLRFVLQKTALGTRPADRDGLACEVEIRIGLTSASYVRH